MRCTCDRDAMDTAPTPMSTLTVRRLPRDTPALAAPIRCLVVDDHPAVRLGLRELLATEPGLEVAEAFATAEQALAFAQRRPCDVAIVDYQLGGRSGLWLSRRLRRLPDPPGVLIYSAFSDHLLAAACVLAQASALVSKAAFGEELAARIREVAAGERRLPAVPPVLADSIRRRFDQQEQAIFGLMSSGIPPAEVAATLRLATTEVDERLGRMLRTLERLDPDHPHPDR
jgi:DNA-binding NarL/FixJ family response regulator